MEARHSVLRMADHVHFLDSRHFDDEAVAFFFFHFYSHFQQ